MAVGVGSGQQSCMARGGPGVGIVVIAIGEVSASIEQKTEAAFAPLIAVALKVVTAKLIYDDNDYKLGTRVVSGTGTCASEA